MVKRDIFPLKFISKKELIATGEYIKNNQYPSGGIPWFKGGVLDPWDHVESAMGLTVAGFYEEAKNAYKWMARMQESDGGYWPGYDDTMPLDKTRKESHHSSYLATGVFHYYLITQDQEFLFDMWEFVEAGIEFSLKLQSDYGEIYWALLPGNKIYRDALITGCSSIYKSLECGILLAREMGIKKHDWLHARYKLREALLKRTDRFDRTWPKKDRYAMDWFYPILCGIYEGKTARKRINQRWDEFVENGLGCRCVSDEPWITVAESCELVLSLLACQMNLRAFQVFSWLEKNRDVDGAYWTGYQKELKIFWPEEKPTWTAGVLLLAVDALMKLTPAANLFVKILLKEIPDTQVSNSLKLNAFK